MFCHKCGTEAREGAIFCEKCGTRLIRDESPGQADAERPEPVWSYGPASSVDTGNTGAAGPAYAGAAPSMEEDLALLRENAGRCPQIRGIEARRDPQGGAGGPSLTGVRLKSTLNSYLFTRNRVTGRPMLSAAWVWPVFLLWVPLCLCDLVFLAFFIQGAVPTAISAVFLAGCAVRIGLLFLCHRERKAVSAFAGETLRCDLSLSALGLGIAAVLNFAGIVLSILSLLWGVGGAGEAPDTPPKDTPPETSLTDVSPEPSESIALTQSYINEEEGFSFKYPEDWKRREDPNAIVVVSTPLGSPDIGNIYVQKMEADSALFTYTEEIYEAARSLDLDDVEIVSLTDCTLDGHPARKLTYTGSDNGVKDWYVQYFYNLGASGFIITIGSLESDYESLEPVFNAIMDSYTITDTAEPAPGIVLTQTFTSEADGLSFMYPADWARMEVSDLVVMLSTSSGANMSIAKGEADRSLDAYTAEEFEAAFSVVLDDFEGVSLTDCTLDGHPARKLTATGSSDGLEFRFIQYYYNQGASSYTISFTLFESDYESLEPVLNAMMDSYTITDAGDPTSDIALTQTYASQTDGFAFMYPADWAQMEDPDAVIYLSTPLGVSMSIRESEVDSALFSYTAEDFEAAFSLILDDIEGVSLTDCTLDGHPARKLTVTGSYDGLESRIIQYYYNQGASSYTVSFTLFESDYESLEPVLNAVMDSYTITDATV